MSINYQTLQYFQVLAHYEHYTRAAKSLYITQSALSKSISSLEDELGIPLFERNGRNVQLTKYGRILYDYVERGMHELDSGIMRLQGMNYSTSGKIKLAISSCPGSDAIPNLLKGFSNKYPEIKIKIYQNDSGSIVERLIDGSIHIAICGQSTENDDLSFLTKVELFSLELGLIVPNSSPFAQKESINFEEVADCEFIGYNDDVSITKTILDALQPLGYIPKINYYISDSQLIAGLVRNNFGIGIVPIKSYIHVPGTTFVRLKHPYLEQKLYLTWNHTRFMPAAVDTFKRYALSYQWN